MTDIAQVFYDLITYILSPFYEILDQFGFNYSASVIMGYSYSDMINFMFTALVFFGFLYVFYNMFKFIYIILLKGLSI